MRSGVATSQMDQSLLQLIGGPAVDALPAVVDGPLDYPGSPAVIVGLGVQTVDQNNTSWVAMVPNLSS